MMEALMATQVDEYIQDYAIQFFPTWLAVVILIAVGFGLWKVAKIVWAAISK
jgi:hypothetical protein